MLAAFGKFKLTLAISVILCCGFFLFALFYNSMPEDYVPDAQAFVNPPSNSKELIYSSLKTLSEQEKEYEETLSDTEFSLPKPDGTVAGFCGAFGLYAIYTARKWGMAGDPVWLLAQWGLESGWGKAAFGYNIGGIKAEYGNEGAASETAENLFAKGILSPDNPIAYDLNGTVQTAYRIVNDEFGRYQTRVPTTENGASVRQWFYYYKTPKAFADGKLRTLSQTRYDEAKRADNLRAFFIALSRGGYGGDSPESYANGVADAFAAVQNQAPAWTDPLSDTYKKADDTAQALIETEGR